MHDDSVGRGHSGGLHAVSFFGFIFCFWQAGRLLSCFQKNSNKKDFPYEDTCGIMSFEYKPKCNWLERKGDIIYETRENIKYKKITKYAQERRLRRMSDFLPVSMQDFLHSWKPDLRAQQIELIQIT